MYRFILSLGALSTVLITNNVSYAAQATQNNNQKTEKAIDLGPQPITMEMFKEEALPEVLFATSRFAFTWKDPNSYVLYFKQKDSYKEFFWNLQGERVEAVFPVGEDILFASCFGNVYYVSAKDFADKVKNNQQPFYKVGKINTPISGWMGDIHWNGKTLLVGYLPDGLLREYALTEDMIKTPSENMLNKISEIAAPALGVVQNDKCIYISNPNIGPNIQMVQNGKIVKNFNIAELSFGKISNRASLYGLAYDKDRNILFIGDWNNQQIHSFHLGADGQSWTYLSSVATGQVWGLKFQHGKLYSGTGVGNNNSTIYEYKLRYGYESGIDLIVPKKTYEEFAHLAVNVVGPYATAHSITNKILYQQLGQKFTDTLFDVPQGYPHVLMPGLEPNSALYLNENGSLSFLKDRSITQIGNIAATGYVMDGDWNKKDTFYVTNTDKKTVTAYTLTPNMLQSNNSTQPQQKWSFNFKDVSGPGGIAAGDNNLIYAIPFWDSANLHILQDNGNSATEVKIIDLKKLGAYISSYSNNPVGAKQINANWFNRSTGLAYDTENKVLFVGAERMGQIYAFHVGADGQTFTYLGLINDLNAEMIKVYKNKDGKTELGVGTYWDQVRDEPRYFNPSKTRGGSRILKYEISYVKGLKESIQNMKSFSSNIDELKQQAIELSKTTEGKDLKELQNILNNLKGIAQKSTEQNQNISKSFDEIKGKTKEFEDDLRVKAMITFSQQTSDNAKISCQAILDLVQSLQIKVDKDLGQQQLIEKIQNVAGETQKSLDELKPGNDSLNKQLAVEDMTALEKALDESSSLQDHFARYKTDATKNKELIELYSQKIEKKDSIQSVQNTFVANVDNINKIVDAIKPGIDQAKNKLKKWKIEQKRLAEANLMLENIKLSSQLAQDFVGKAKAAFDENTKKPAQLQCDEIAKEKENINKILSTSTSNTKLIGIKLKDNKKMLDQLLPQANQVVDQIKGFYKTVEDYLISAQKTLASSLDEAAKENQLKVLFKQIDDLKIQSDNSLKTAQVLKDTLSKDINENKLKDASSVLDNLVKIDSESLRNQLNTLQKSFEPLGTSDKLKTMILAKNDAIKNITGNLDAVNSIISQSKQDYENAVKAEKDLEQKRADAQKIDDSIKEDSQAICGKTEAKTAQGLQEAKTMFNAVSKKYQDMQTTFGSFNQLKDILSHADENMKKAGICVQDEKTLSETARPTSTPDEASESNETETNKETEEAFN